MKTIHQHSCHEANAVNTRAMRITALGSTSTVTTYPWLDTDMAFANKRQRLKDHPG